MEYLALALLNEYSSKNHQVSQYLCLAYKKVCYRVRGGSCGRHLEPSHSMVVGEKAWSLLMAQRRV